METSFIALSLDQLADRGGVAVVNQSPVGGSKLEGFEWPLPEELRLQLDQWQRISNDSTPLDVGKRLYNHLLPGSVKQVLGFALRESQGSARTLFAISSTLPTINMLPFEIVHDGNEYLQSGNRVVFRHVNDGARIEPRLGVVENVLVVLAAPTEYPEWEHDRFAGAIQEFLANWQVSYRILRHASPGKLLGSLADEVAAGRSYDVVLVVAHGKGAGEQNDGYLILENGAGQPAELQASQLSTGLSGHKGCLLVLISCSTGAVREGNPLAGVAHRSIYNGQVGAVIAMQRRITVDAGLQICQDLLGSLRRNNDIFTAFRDGINLAVAAGVEQGTPCLYARLPRDGAPGLFGDSDERLCLRSLFSLSTPDNCYFALSLPAFRMGLTPSDYHSRKPEWINIPDTVFKYRGATASRADVGSIQSVIALLGKLLPVEVATSRISIVTDDELRTTLERPDVSHIFVVGSRSHAHARPALQQYGQDFSIEYDENAWHIIDQTTGVRYSRPDPSKGDREKDYGDDFALLEKIVTINRVIFFIAGLWDTSTLAAGQYLVRERRDIVNRFGMGGFQILLKIAAGSTNVRDVLIRRRPSLKRLSNE